MFTLTNVSPPIEIKIKDGPEYLAAPSAIVSFKCRCIPCLPRFNPSLRAISLHFMEGDCVYEPRALGAKDGSMKSIDVW